MPRSPAHTLLPLVSARPQEVATVSGLAAAHQLGASYPFADDPLAARQFDTFLAVAHGAKRRAAGAPGPADVTALASVSQAGKPSAV